MTRAQNLNAAINGYQRFIRRTNDLWSISEMTAEELRSNFKKISFVKRQIGLTKKSLSKLGGAK